MKLDKTNNFQNEIYFIDGLWGSGKSLLGPILSYLENSEKQQINVIFDQLSILLNQKKISKEASNLLLKITLDRLIYEIQLGREFNFRLYDDTGLINNPNLFKNLKKLFLRDINIESNEFKEKSLILMTHMVLIGSDLFFSSNNDFKIKVFEIVRHPLFIFNHWYSFLYRFKNDRKITYPSYYINNERVPWFAKTWYKEYISYNYYDRTLKSIIYCYERLFQKIDMLKNRKDLLILSFESLIFDSRNSLNKINEFTNRNFSIPVDMILKKQKLPRKSINEGKGHLKYDWQKNNLGFKEDYSLRLSSIKTNCNLNLYKEFKNIIEFYEKKFPFKI